MKRIIATTFALCCSLFFCCLFAQPDVTFTSWKTGFSSPVDIANPGDGTDRLFIVERNGLIKVIENDIILATPFLDITALNSCCGERGLLGLVFHPDYAVNGYFYVNYTDNGGDTNISRFEVDPNDINLADPNSEVIILEVEQPYSNHNAGDLNFGPFDGYLYIPFGDGGSGGDPEDRSQDGSCLLGKMLRVDVDGGGSPATESQSGGDCDFTSSANYTIPGNNPFRSDPNVLNEIWSMGLRNPWRFSFDKVTGDMWIADVGQGAWEEVNFESVGDGGGNYGWRCYEGDHAYNLGGGGDCNESYVTPVFEYDHTEGYSITGGYIYRGSIFPNMVGYYITTDYGTEKTWAIFRDVNGNITTTSYTISGINAISSFGEDEAGELYAASLSSGTIYKVEDTSPLPVELSSFTGFREEGFSRLRWTTATEYNFDYFDIEKSTDGRNFYSIGKVEANGENQENNQAYEFKDQQTAYGDNYYRLKIVDKDAQFEYSKTIGILIERPFDLSIHPNPNNGRFSIISNGTQKGNGVLKIYSSKGEVILQEDMEQLNAINQTVDLSQYPKGVYLVQISSRDYVETVKLLIK
jgi:glucose/arabinose dehydrogenase